MYWFFFAGKKDGNDCIDMYVVCQDIFRNPPGRYSSHFTEENIEALRS